MLCLLKLLIEKLDALFGIVFPKNKLDKHLILIIYFVDYSYYLFRVIDNFKSFKKYNDKKFTLFVMIFIT